MATEGHVCLVGGGSRGRVAGRNVVATERSTALAEEADRLLAAHRPGEPLLLANAWDASSARLVEEAGFAFLATSSRAVAQVLGHGDDDTADPDLTFEWIGRIRGSVSIPLTADLEAGYGLEPAALVRRLLGAGAVGCNLEDSDHHGSGLLVDADRQAEYLAAVRSAADAEGVHIVVNARVDTFIRGVGDEGDQLAEAVRRGRLYLGAGADCVYPIAAARDEDIASLVDSLGGRINVTARPDRRLIGRLAELGVARISLATGLFQVSVDATRATLASIK
ncbi:MAG: isocitrate lyase/PEP mutase family protein [Acidimicrobiales bacterium]